MRRVERMAFEVDVVSDDKYRLLIESVVDYAIYMLDPDGFVISWNPGAQRFKGYAEREILGQHFSRFYTPEDQAAQQPRRALETAQREGRFESEGWRVRKDGSRFWAHVVIDPILHPRDRKPLGFAKITRDLTDRKLAADALKRSEQSFRLLVQGVTDYAIFMLDPAGNVANWNAGAERIKGYAPAEIVGRHFSVFYTAEDRAQGEPDRILEIAREEGSFRTEGWRIRKGGERFWASVVIDAIHDENDEVIGFAKITRDMTERREADAALMAAREALYQSQKMEALGQLTGGIAHDFNNLLNAVVGSLELLRKQLGDERQRRLIDNAMAGARRGMTLTQRMLAFARKQDLQTAPVDVDALVTGMTDLIARSLGPAVALQTSFPAGLDRAIADPNQLELALLNLAVNARDAMPDGGRIVIGARNERLERAAQGLAPGDYVSIFVADSGSGMDQETLERAAEPFFTTKGVGKGTGLGLSMVAGTAEQLGGKLILESRIGKGTTASIWLPSVPAQPLERPGDDAAPDGFRDGGLLRILAVDDDALVLMNTTALLEDLGHTVFEASSAKQALELLSTQPDIQLLVTDHAMPQMTGAQLIGEVVERWPDLPIILATGYAEAPHGLPARVKRLGKPFWQKDLEKAIGEVLSDPAGE
ncbi:histidine kinase [Bosea sp. Leaf344]|uniref:hybrid sensor histidine kinase/response regulator n=1 Tax=Bosea sp. Leaf344 TaxID=1736346 RepID=UPI0006F5A0ED|nr:PAS domain S-box protein [Bosea sp. Leaf344]KQU54579.1 histidine kinase [Bosea sp. Leaf344]